MLDRLDRAAGRPVQRIGLWPRSATPRTSSTGSRGRAGDRSGPAPRAEDPGSSRSPSNRTRRAGPTRLSGWSGAAAPWSSPRPGARSSGSRPCSMGASPPSTATTPRSRRPSGRRPKRPPRRASRSASPAPSTLELGIDIGDLDLVVQLGPPASVASFLQRLGRTGRRGLLPPRFAFVLSRPRDLVLALGAVEAAIRRGTVGRLPPSRPYDVLAQQLLLALAKARRPGARSCSTRWAVSDRSGRSPRTRSRSCSTTSSPRVSPRPTATCS